MGPTKEQAAHLTIRVGWVVNLALLIVGLAAKGWYVTEYKGNSAYTTPAFQDNWSGRYGLFSVEYNGPGGPWTMGYDSWAKAVGNPTPFLDVHGSRVAAVICAIACVLTAVAYIRSSRSTARVVQIFTAARCAWLAGLDLGLNLTVLGLWGILNRDAAFTTVCNQSGCFQIPVEGFVTSTISYNWALWFVRAFIQSCLLMAACYLAMKSRIEIQFSTPKSATAEMFAPSAPLQAKGFASKV